MSTPQQPSPHEDPHAYASPGPAPAPQPMQGPFSPPAAQKLNVMGLIALALVAVECLLAFIWPFFYRFAMDGGNFSAISVITSISHWVLVVPAIALGIVGVLQKQAPRARWAAFAALGAAGSSAIALLGSMLGNAIAFGF